MNFSLILLILHNLFFFLVRLGAVCILPQRHSPAVAMTWLLIILFWPLPGGLLYLALGSTELPKLRKDRHERALRRLRQTVGHDAFCPEPVLTEDLATIGRLGTTLAQWPVQHAGTMELLDSEEALIAQLVEAVDEAERNAYLLYYIFEKDRVTAPLIEALRRAAGRGVECRLLLDDLGSKKFLRKESASLEKAGVRTARALPLSRLRRTRLTARFDLRNHRKLAVIDGRVAFVGSHNITEATYGGKARGRKWEDLTLRLTGPIVGQLQGVFLEDWYVETSEVLHHDEPFRAGDLCEAYRLQTVPSGPAYSTENYQRLVAAALFQARERVIITTPYLIPDEGLLQALEVACLNGARVDLVVPLRSDQFFVGNAGKAYFSQLMDKGVAIHLFEPDIVHAKTMTVDGRMAFFGSSNFDIRSFTLNFELNMALYGEKETASIISAQERYLAGSRRLDAATWRRRPLWRKTVEGVSKLLSPIL